MVAWMQPPSDHELFKEVMVAVGTFNGTPKWTAAINNVGWSSASVYSHTTRNLGTGGLHQRWLKSTDASVVMAITDAGLTLTSLVISGNLTVQGVLQADGNVLLGNAPGDTVITSGPVTVGTTLLVTTDLTVNGEANIKGNVTLGDAITDTVLAAGPVTMNATLNVKGSTTLGDAVGDTTAISGDVTVGRDATISGELEVLGNVQLGNGTGDTVNTSGPLTVGDNLTVDEDATIDGSLTVGNGISVTAGGLAVTGGGISVTAGGINVAQSSVFQASVDFQDGFDVTNGSVDIQNGDLNVDGQAIIETITVDGTGNVFTFNGSSQTQTTVGAAGGASALPATPRWYLKVTVGATSGVIPIYNN